MTGLRRLVHEVHRRSLWQVLGIYLLGSWGALQVVDLMVDNYGLPEWFPPFALALIVIGLPIVLATAFVQEGAPAGTAPPSAPAGSEALTSASAAGSARPGRPDILFTWRNAILGGVAASLLWGAAAVGWFALGRRNDAPSKGAGPSVAVLPFANRSNEEGSEHWADGLHDDLLTQLSKVSGLRVISRTSVQQYRDSDKTIRTIGEELGVGAILEGGVERLGDQLRVNVQLIDSRTDAHLWAETYDETLTAANLFAIRSDLTRQIADALRASLTPVEEMRVSRAPTDNLAAYELVLRGRELYEGDAEDVERSLELFRQATRLEDDYAEAWAWLGNAFAQRVQKGGYGRIMADSAVWAARRAIELDPEEPMGHKALGLGLNQRGSLREGAQAYARAVELSPSWTAPRVNLSATAIWTGRPADGIRLMLEARVLDPRDPFPPGHLAIHWMGLGEQAEADRWLARARATDPDWYWAPMFDALIGMRIGDVERARRAATDAMARTGSDGSSLHAAYQVERSARDAAGTERLAGEYLRRYPDADSRGSGADIRIGLTWARRALGKPEGTQALLDEAEAGLRAALDRGVDDPNYPYLLGASRALRGDADAALTWLERAVDAGFRSLTPEDPRYDAVRDMPRYRAQVERVEADLARQRASVAELLGTGR